MKFTNTAPGARGILLKDGSTVFVSAGETIELEEGAVKSVYEGIEKGTKAAKEAAAADDDAK
jgi:hypothetical protein